MSSDWVVIVAMVWVASLMLVCGASFARAARHSRWQALGMVVCFTGAAFITCGLVMQYQGEMIGHCCYFLKD